MGAKLKMLVVSGLFLLTHFLLGQGFVLEKERGDLGDSGYQIVDFKSNGSTYPASHDWRELGMVSPVKDQGACGACWAFTIIANIESFLRISLGKEEVLSEQYLIDCVPSRVGCSSASIIGSFAEIVSELGGIAREADYFPYVSHQMPCRLNDVTKLVPVAGFGRVDTDEDVMAEFVYRHGPLAVAINSASMAKYQHSNYIDEPTEDQCSHTKLDHSVLIVGYSEYLDNQTGHRVPYWIIKNSWGNNWGDSGFYYLVRGRNACGIASDVSYGIVNFDP